MQMENDSHSAENIDRPRKRVET